MAAAPEEDEVPDEDEPPDPPLDEPLPEELLLEWAPLEELPPDEDELEEDELTGWDPDDEEPLDDPPPEQAARNIETPTAMPAARVGIIIVLATPFELRSTLLVLRLRNCSSSR
jgi:hypothetical protein